jgi:hypothetical protein
VLGTARWSCIHNNNASDSGYNDLSVVIKTENGESISLRENSWRGIAHKDRKDKNLTIGDSTHITYVVDMISYDGDGDGTTETPILDDIAITLIRNPRLISYVTR